MPAPNSGSRLSTPVPTDPRPTARSNASTAPWPPAGPSPACSPANQPAETPSPPGCTSTTITGPTPPSEPVHRSPD
jgi:hypothetical protein